MPENRKYFPHNAAVFCTARTEVGLPFVASILMNLILWGIIARAKEQFAVKVCHFIFMANHFHMLLVVDNPEDLSRFIGYVKAESAHAVNRLLGRRQRTIWKDGYDSPILLSAHDAIKCIRYIYANPSKANLVTTIADYPGVSSWGMFIKGLTKRSCKRLRRNQLEPLKSPAMGVNEQKRLTRAYETESISEHEFVLEPDAWMDCFPELKREEKAGINARILKGLRKDEERYARRRARANKEVLGSTFLRQESMTKEHEPTTFGRKTICICYDCSRRRAFIEIFREVCAEARMVYERWRRGELTAKLPPGLFAPRVPSLVSALGIPE